MWGWSINYQLINQLLHVALHFNNRLNTVDEKVPCYQRASWKNIHLQLDANAYLYKIIILSVNENTSNKQLQNRPTRKDNYSNIFVHQKCENHMIMCNLHWIPSHALNTRFFSSGTTAVQCNLYNTSPDSV